VSKRYILTHPRVHLPDTHTHTITHTDATPPRARPATNNYTTVGGVQTLRRANATDGQPAHNDTTPQLEALTDQAQAHNRIQKHTKKTASTMATPTATHVAQASSGARGARRVQCASAQKTLNALAMVGRLKQRLSVASLAGSAVRGLSFPA
jgi:hypothetical protein